MPTANSCPWDGYDASPVNFCEADVCGWLVEPMNSISCIGFVLAGFWLLGRTRRDGMKGFPSWFGPVAILIGVLSVALHATMTRWGSYLDIASMFLMSAMFLTLNLRRWLVEQNRRARPVRFYTSLVGGALGINLIPFSFPMGIWLFGAIITATGVLELVLWRTQKRKVDYRWFWATCFLFFSSLLLWTLEMVGTTCHPENHYFQWHAVWHLGCAFAITTYYRFFAQFEH